MEYLIRCERRDFCVPCMCVVCRANLLYGVLMIVAAIPSSIAGARYMKLLYHLSLEQINGERQKGYLQAIATSRSYAQSIRFFHAGTRLKEKYQRLWKTMFEARRDMNRRQEHSDQSFGIPAGGCGCLGGGGHFHANLGRQRHGGRLLPVYRIGCPALVQRLPFAQRRHADL